MSTIRTLQQKSELLERLGKRNSRICQDCRDKVKAAGKRLGSPPNVRGKYHTCLRCGGPRDIKRAVREWMEARLNELEHVDPLTGLANLTSLSEGAAHAFEHDDWLDNSDHWVWELAVSAADASGRGE